MNLIFASLTLPDAGTVANGSLSIAQAETWWTFSNIGNLSSVVGFIISILGLYITWLTFKKASTIANYYLFQARVPELQRDISSHCENIFSYLSDFANSANKIEVELVRCRSNLQNLSTKVADDTILKGAVVALIEKINRRRRDNTDETWEIYKLLVALEIDLKNLQKDLSWSPKNAA